MLVKDHIKVIFKGVNACKRSHKSYLLQALTNLTIQSQKIKEYKLVTRIPTQ